MSEHFTSAEAQSLLESFLNTAQDIKKLVEKYDRAFHFARPRVGGVPADWKRAIQRIELELQFIKRRLGE